jgi:hypothetical protein
MSQAHTNNLAAHQTLPPLYFAAHNINRNRHNNSDDGVHQNTQANQARTQPALAHPP